MLKFNDLKILLIPLFIGILGFIPVVVIWWLTLHASFEIILDVIGTIILYIVFVGAMILFWILRGF